MAEIFPRSPVDSKEHAYFEDPKSGFKISARCVLYILLRENHLYEEIQGAIDEILSSEKEDFYKTPIFKKTFYMS